MSGVGVHSRLKPPVKAEVVVAERAVGVAIGLDHRDAFHAVCQRAGTLQEALPRLVVPVPVEQMTAWVTSAVGVPAPRSV